MPDADVPHATLGALFIGLGISSAFYGVTCLQACRYFRRYHKDRLLLRFTVAVVWALESLNIALVVHALNHYLILNRGKMKALMYISWSLYLPAGTNSASASLIQLFFAWRVYILSSKNKALTGLICALSTSQCVLGLVTAIQGIRYPNASSRALVLVGPASFAATAVTDIVITSSLCYYLHTKKTGYQRTNNLVNSLLVLTINNGILSSTLALLAFITNITNPDSMISFACCFVLGKAYANTLLSSLNGRESWKQESSHIPLYAQFRSKRSTPSAATGPYGGSLQT